MSELLDYLRGRGYRYCPKCRAYMPLHRQHVGVAVDRHVSKWRVVGGAGQTRLERAEGS